MRKHRSIITFVVSLLTTLVVAAVAQEPKLGPQPDGSCVIRWPKGTPGTLTAFSGDLNRGICPAEAQTLALRYDPTGVGWQGHASVSLSGGFCYLNGAGATWQDDLVAQTRNYRVVPAGSRLLLNISPPPQGSLNLSPLSQLAPGDLYTIAFSPHSLPGKVGPRPGDAVMPHIARLTGLKCLDLGCTKVTAKGLKQLVRIKGLEQLVVPYGTTDEALAEVATLPNLKSVGGLYSVTDRGLEILAGIPTLEELEISSSGITDAGLAHLTRLPRLRFLQIWGPLCKNITDAGMAHVARISSLRTLNVSHLSITDAGLAELAKLPDLEGLDLFNTQVTDEGIARLKSLPSLKTLNFTGGDMQENRVRITDRGVIHLSEIKSLESLSVHYSEEVLPYLCKLPHIKTLHARSDAGAARISEVPSLEYASVGAEVTAAGLAYLTRLKNLDRLGLSVNKDSQCAELLAQVARLTSLKTLCITGGADSPLKASDLKQLNSLANLMCLHVYAFLQQDGTGLDLSGLTSLKYLNLHVNPAGPAFTDRDLTTILRLPNLRELEMTGDFTDEAKARVARLPKLKSWSGVDLNAIRAGQPERRPAAIGAGAGKAPGKPQTQREKPR